MNAAAPASGTRTIELELHQSVWACLESCGLDDVERRITRRAVELLSGVGISSTPGVALRPVSGKRAVRAFVAGGEKSFPPAFLARLWFSVAPPDLLEMAFDPALSGKDGGHGWLVAAAAELAAVDRADGRRAVCDVVEHLAVEVVSLHPGALLGEQEAVEYLGDAGNELSAADATAVLRRLLELGISLGERDRVRELVRGATDLGQSTAEVCEESLAALRAKEIEVHLDARSFDGLLDGRTSEQRLRLEDEGLNPILVEAMTLVRDLRLRSLGADLPVVFVRAGEARDCEMRIKINDRLAPPVPLPAPGEVGVSAPARMHEREGIDGRGLVDPVTGGHLSAVDEKHSDALVQAGYIPVLPSAYLAGAFGRAVTVLAHRLIAVDRVEGMLARFEEEFPVLVHATLARHSLAELTGVLRELVREQVPIDDLWRVLNALTAFEDVERPLVGDGDRLNAALARVRLELADRIVLNSCGLEEIQGGTAVVYETEPALEERVQGWSEAAPTDDELRAARLAVWDALAQSGQPVEPVILTSPGARPLLRAALDHELPDVHVLARSEIPLGVRVEQAGVVVALS